MPSAPAADHTATALAALEAHKAHIHELPTSPVFILRQAILRGHPIAVVALSPVFVQDGAVRVATRIQAELTDARVLSPESIAAIMQAPFAPMAQLDQPIQTTAAQTHTGQPVWRLTVSQAGIHRITGQMLADVGMNLTTTSPNLIHIRRQGADLALDLRGLDDGTFAADDEIRFYAPEPGDRWNATDTYFLGIESTPAPRMATRAVAANAGAPLTLRTTATERGVWRQHARYNPALPGPDGDHWFASHWVMPITNNQANSLRIEITSPLPLASGPVSLTVLGATASASGTQHALTVRMGGATAHSPADGSFHGAGNWAHSVILSDNQPAVEVQLSSTQPDSYTLDSLAYARPVQLSFAGQNGSFWSEAGAWAYQLEGVPAQPTFYDLTDIDAPVVLTNVESAQIHDDHAVAAEPRHYWVSGASTMASPAISLDTSARITDLAQWAGIDQIYIVPRALRSSLTPLLDLRQAQRHQVQAVEVELIYDTWSGGQVSPQAIRQFVRHAVGQNPALKAITLVGDGSNDPRNFLGHGNPTLIPPYLAMVDPWLGETACDTCYAQLDGDDPLSDLLPDVLIGRLPVKSPAELTQLVNKIIAYESAPVGAWNWRSGHLADNYQEANGQPDPAGNFPAYQDAAVELQPPSVEVRRVYFDPYLPSADDGVWRMPDPVQTHRDTLALFNEGAAIINFQGHGYYDRLGQTALAPGSPVNYLLHTQDVAGMTNGSKLPFVIEMACWTSAFHQPLAGAATLDEALVLAPNGGAIATWGSTGWGVAYQHKHLQKGVYEALWATPHMDASVGEVVHNGLMSMFAADCCKDALRTYVLLGDPLTVLHALIPTRTLLPLAMNQ